MTIIEKIRVRWKIKMLVRGMNKYMTPEDVWKGINTIKFCLHNLPQCKKEGLLDQCLEVIRNVKKV